MKKKIVALGVALLMLVGCETDSGSRVSTDSAKELETVSHEQEKMQDYLELSGLKLRLVGDRRDGLIFVVGQIENTHPTKGVEKFVKMTFLDEEGKVVTVRPYNLKIGAGETVYFDELAGRANAINEPTRMVINGVDD